MFVFTSDNSFLWPCLSLMCFCSFYLFNLSTDYFRNPWPQQKSCHFKISQHRDVNLILSQLDNLDMLEYTFTGWYAVVKEVFTVLWTWQRWQRQPGGTWWGWIKMINTLDSILDFSHASLSDDDTWELGNGRNYCSLYQWGILGSWLQTSARTALTTISDITVLFDEPTLG